VRNLRLHLLSFPIFFAASLCSLAEFPDGLWNGKRTPTEQLKEGVAKKDPHSLAEWADCSRNGLPGIPYDIEAAYQHAKEAAELGNPYGMAITARCYLKGLGTEKAPQKGLAWAKKSAATGHPLGLKVLANYYHAGAGGLKKSLAKYADFNNKAANAGSILARGNRAGATFEGLFGFPKNRNKGMKEMIECMETAETAYPAINVLVYIEDFPNFEMLTPKVIALAELRVRTSAEAGCQESMSRLGIYYRDTGRPNKGLPLIIKAAQKPHPFASEKAFWACYSTSANRRGGAVGQYSTYFRFARDAYDTGNRNDDIINAVAESYIYSWGDEPHQPDRALPYLEGLIERNYGKARKNLAKVLVSEGSKKAYDIERGRAILLYLGARGQGLHSLVDSYFICKPADRDLTKGYAASHAATKFLTGVSLEQVTRRQTNTLKRMTPEQKEAAEKLIKADFPLGRKFQEAAIATMIKNGDAPEGTKYRKPRR